MAKIKEFLNRIFRGRYGTDSLNSFLLWTYFVFTLLSLFTGIDVFLYAGVICFVFAIIRMFSKNYYKRQQENVKFFQMKTKVKQKFNLARDKWRFRKTHIYRKCPNCKANIKLPKIKGQHKCRCPRCKKEFNVFC